MTDETLTSGVPMRPDQVGGAQAEALPPEVLDVFNQLIASRFVGNSATVKQEDAVVAIMAALNIDRRAVFDRHYLNIEEVFRSVGWHVKYDKPGYNEEYPATFEFRRP